MMSDFAVVIPSRYPSVRLPGKPLRLLLGKPMVQHVYERATASLAAEVIVATDDQRIADAVEAFGGQACMTGDHHRSGSERIAEVATIYDWPDDRIVVNVQGDEPAMRSSLVDQCAKLLAESGADIATLASSVQSDEDFQSPNVVKVIRDNRGDAIYFSRATIPYPRDPDALATARATALHHHGIYAYRCGALRRLVAADVTSIETCESLEQLRALALGMRIAVGVPDERPGNGVDTEDDLKRAEEELSALLSPDR